MDRIIEKSDLGWWIVSHEQKLWLPAGEIPYGAAEKFDLVGLPALKIGEWQGEPVWLIQQPRRNDMGSVRQVLDQDVGLFQLAGRGVQLAEFYRSHKYCGYCGHTMHPSKTEWAMLCSHCRERYYPQIAPCIIVAIRRDDSILLAQHTRHRNGIHTVLAGFVEVGETLEQAVAREVMEESGIKVKNLRYVTSQPWPFPASLMMAFKAQALSTDILVDGEETETARWVTRDEYTIELSEGRMEAPGKSTIARYMIEEWYGREL